MTRLRVAVTALALLASLAACDIRTATAPTGDLTLHASFDDVQDLTAGHNVQASNVVVGSVRDISLDGYRARVKLSIVDGRRVPEGTTAVIRHTSVLGEAFVDLVFPEGFDPDVGPFLADDAEIVDTDSQDGIEQLAQEAAGIISALAGSDIAGAIEAGAVALNGRGELINQLVRDAGSFADAVAGQTGDISALVDGLARIGAEVAPQAGQIGTLIDQLTTATGNLAGSRDRTVRAVEALVGLATATNENILVPHAERIRGLLAELNPLMRFLADRSAVLETLIVDLLRFTQRFPGTVYNGQVLLLSWAFVDTNTLGQLAPLDALATLVRPPG